MYQYRTVFFTDTRGSHAGMVAGVGKWGPVIDKNCYFSSVSIIRMRLFDIACNCPSEVATSVLFCQRSMRRLKYF